jgi:hypothetical protein
MLNNKKFAFSSHLTCCSTLETYVRFSRFVRPSEEIGRLNCAAILVYWRSRRFFQIETETVTDAGILHVGPGTARKSCKIRAVSAGDSPERKSCSGKIRVVLPGYKRRAQPCERIHHQITCQIVTVIG